MELWLFKVLCVACIQWWAEFWQGLTPYSVTLCRQGALNPWTYLLGGFSMRVPGVLWKQSHWTKCAHTLCSSTWDTLSWVSRIALWGIVVQRSTVGETWTRPDKRKQTNKQINLRTTAKGKKTQEGQVKRLWIKSYRGVGGTTCTICDFFSHHLIEVWRMRKVWWNGKQQPTSLLYLEWKLLVTQDVLLNDVREK